MNPYRSYWQMTLMRIAFWYVTPKQVKRNAKIARKEAKAAGRTQRIERDES